MRDERLEVSVSEMLRFAGIRCGFSLQDLAGGGNNRVYLVQTSDARFLLKRYYRDTENTNKRLHSEFAFSSFAWSSGIDAVPRPVAKDEDASLALYEFIDGEPLRAEEIDRGSVRQALAFFLSLNSPERREEARKLPEAAEACFSIEQHLHCVKRRIELLLGMETETSLQREAKRFVQEELSEKWRKIADRVRRWASEEGGDLCQELTSEKRCVSPSDFGFHNALREPDGRLRFFDFEYAGRDDPAKAVCDFFCQPSLPVPSDCWEIFAPPVAEMYEDADLNLRRFEMLLPVYRVKWCCIMLNPFLPAGSSRRSFAMCQRQLDDYKEEQLAKAKRSANCTE